VYVTDAELNTVEKYDPSGPLLARWGNATPAASQADGQFTRASGIAIDRMRGWVYVSDREAGRIQKFTLDGRFLARFDGFGGPDALAVDDAGFVYVSDDDPSDPTKRSARLLKLAPDGVRVADLATIPRSNGLAVDSEGYVYTTGDWSVYATQLTPSGRRGFIWQVAESPVERGAVASLGGVAYDVAARHVWVSDPWDHRIDRFTTQVRLVGRCRGVTGQALAVGPDGDLWTVQSSYVIHVGMTTRPNAPCDGIAPVASGVHLSRHRLTLPSRRRSYRRTVTLRLSLSEPVIATVTVSRLRGRRGLVPVLSRFVRLAKGPGRVVLRLRLRAPNAYRVDTTVADGARNESARRSQRFTVRGPR
jgi:sugar lactone lactonase YvrE